MSSTTPLVSTLKFASHIVFDISKWIIILLIARAYNKFSLDINSFYAGLAFDALVLMASIFIISLYIEGFRTGLDINAFYASVTNITLLALIAPIVDSLISIEDDLINFLAICAIFITFQYIIEKAIDKVKKIRTMTKLYSIVACLVILLIVLNYRVHFHFHVETITPLHESGRFIMANSYSWIIENV